MTQLQLLHTLTITMLSAPLLGALVAGIAGKVIGRRGAHGVTISGIAVAFLCALYFFKYTIIDGGAPYNATLYLWGESGSFHFPVGVLIDSLSAVMMVTVTFVSLLVHIYSIGYMADDAGYQRFFSYMSLFTFAMLCLVAANNFLLLFFGWEGVGLASYLLIGFWFKRESAVQGSLKAFLVNRAGDFGFILGIAAILDSVGSLDYNAVFAKASQLGTTALAVCPGGHCETVTLICLLLFVGAMGKSAQVPLHVWLPESMEGPTPISALIHAATMVTAGIYMVARMSPLFELSHVALSVVLVVGATGALFLGILGVVQNDIKRVIAYSTMSQLGYMMAANGAQAFSAGIFHLMTHAAFKALLFLGAGSVIIAMHHEQDMRKMGGLRKYMPITYVTFLIGSLALVAFPPFAGFYSKDAIIDAVKHASIPGATYAYVALTIGAFVTALYTFRAFFMTFHTKERMDEKTRSHLKESPWVVTLPLILLAIPSVLLGMGLAGPMLYAAKPWLSQAIHVPAQWDVLKEMAKHYHGPFLAIASALTSPAFWLSLLGILTAWLCYERYPHIPGMLVKRCSLIYQILVRKYGFDDLNQWVFVKGARALSGFLYHVSDMILIDHFFVNGSGRGVKRVARWARCLQTGYLYHYAFAMILGLFGFLGWLVWNGLVG